MPVFERVILTGERVVLEPNSLDHVAETFALIHDREEILRWLVWEGPETPDDMRPFFERWIVPSDAGNDYFFVVRERNTGAVVGSIGSRFIDHPGTGDVGYWLGEEFWGHGYMTEAIRLVSWFSFRHLGAAALCACVFHGNDGSRRVLEKNGFQLVRSCSGRTKRGKVMQEWHFTLLASEWEGSELSLDPVGVEIR